MHRVARATILLGLAIVLLAPASLAQGAPDGLRITWTHDCPLVAEPPSPTPVVPAAGEQSARGATGFTLDPSRGVGGAAYSCTVVGVASDDAGQTSGEVDASFTAKVDYDGNVTVEVLAASRQAGPQKIIRYPIEITNHGNARTRVAFEVVGRLPGKWDVLVPEAVIVEPGQSLTATAAVATPFENGYVSDSTDIVLRAVPSAAEDPDVVGPPIELTLHATAKGWYVPGPGPALLALALAGAAALARRR